MLTWNVRSLRDDAAGVAQALVRLRPDVALLQEAPRLLGWRRACRRLARDAGLVRVAGGAPAAGNLLLVSARTVVVEAHAVRLPRRRGLHRRGAVLAVLEHDGHRLGVLGTHLDLDAAARLHSAVALRAAVPASYPLLVGADVNDLPGTAPWQALAEGLVDLGAVLGPTFPQRRPDRRIDALLADPALRPVGTGRPDPGPVTDHLPVVADLCWA